MDATRPLDALNLSRNKRVMVELKGGQGGRRYVGILRSFDIHINTVLDEAEEYSADGEMLRKLGLVFIRGDTITIISPQ